MRPVLVLALALTASPAAAQQVVVSDAPAAVAVSVYRAPDRAAESPIERGFPEGYALITEQRRVHLPAGRAVIRFQGVASGIFAETVVVSGLPSGVREKNLDADLLSPRTLYDRSIGRRVMIRRTDKKTGRSAEEQAIIRSGAGGAAVIQTAAGIEAVQCDGWHEQLVYDAVPPGLTPKPTLSIETESTAEADATLTLSYLAGGFDWGADYVIRLRPGGQGADLFAWVTLASGDLTAFADAETGVVAGKPNREDTPDPPSYIQGALQYRCWPRPSYTGEGAVPPPPMVMAPPPPAPVMAMARMAKDEIVVTGSRIARQEELGDLKYYRLPERVTVASKAQKQVAMLARPSVSLEPVYASDAHDEAVSPPKLVLRTRNRADQGLGLPLPAGRAVVFEEGARPLLVGEAAIDDKAIGEEVEFRLTETVGVAATATTQPPRGKRRPVRLTVTNANPWPITYEAKFRVAPGATVHADGVKLATRDGQPLWRTTVPANGSATLDYWVRSPG